MQYPAVLRKGTIIRIGPRPPDKYIQPSAIGLEIELHQDIYQDMKRAAKEKRGNQKTISTYQVTKSIPIVKNPNGWFQDSVYYAINLAYDEIVSLPSNKDLKNSLIRIDD